MDTPDNAGSTSSYGQLVYYANLRRQKAAARKYKLLADSRPEAFTELVEALTQGDSTLTDTLLRLWGVRR